jgi:hypothetical protein
VNFDSLLGGQVRLEAKEELGEPVAGQDGIDCLAAGRVAVADQVALFAVGPRSVGYPRWDVTLLVVFA